MKVYVQMDYLANVGNSYLSASYRDFVPETTKFRRLLAKTLKVKAAQRTKRIGEVEKAILKKEHVMFTPIRQYIESQIASGAKMTPSYFSRKGVTGLEIRKQNWFPYWKVIAESIDLEEEEEEEEEEEYNDTALTQIHEWLTGELQRGFSGWSIEQDFDVFEASEYTAAYTQRTFEFGLIRASNVNPDALEYHETYYYMVFNNNKMQAYEMWKGFDYMGFNREMRRIGVWKE